MAKEKEQTPAVEIDVHELVAKMRAEGKKIVVFSLKQQYFDAILSGRKVQEFREIRPTTIKRLILLDEEGFDLLDKDGFAQPIRYDAILFYTGAYNNKHRDCALVEVEDCGVQYLTDDDGKIIEFKVDYNGYKDIFWQAYRVVYNLGKILAVKTYLENKKKHVH